MDQSPHDVPPTRPARSFPGGQVRLPRLSGANLDGKPQIDMVDTAFVGGGTKVVEEAPPSGFTGYFTYESLFEEPPESPDIQATEDPYAVLRVDPGQDWATIVAAHRALVKEFHPDRFVDQPAEVIEQAEIEIKRINLAYSELRKRHAAADLERRTGRGRRAEDR